MLGVLVKSVGEINLALLLPHEEVEREKVNELLLDIKKNGLRNPIVVAPYQGKYLIVDGHHRVEAFNLLKRKRIKAIIIDYFAPRLKAINWKNGKEFDKKEIIRLAFKGKKFKPKTTKHLIIYEGEKFHVSILSKLVGQTSTKKISEF